LELEYTDINKIWIGRPHFEVKGVAVTTPLQTAKGELTHFNIKDETGLIRIVLPSDQVDSLLQIGCHVTLKNPKIKVSLVIISFTSIF
jgi:hypothetical protein